MNDKLLKSPNIKENEPDFPDIVFERLIHI